MYDIYCGSIFRDDRIKPLRNSVTSSVDPTWEANKGSQGVNRDFWEFGNSFEKIEFIFVTLEVNRDLGQNLIFLGSGTRDTCHVQGVTRGKNCVGHLDYVRGHCSLTHVPLVAARVNLFGVKGKRVHFLSMKFKHSSKPVPHSLSLYTMGVFMSFRARTSISRAPRRCSN